MTRDVWDESEKEDDRCEKIDQVPDTTEVQRVCRTDRRRAARSQPASIELGAHREDIAVVLARVNHLVHDPANQLDSAASFRVFVVRFRG